VFWTTRISEDLTSINPERGTARFHATNMAIPDFRDFPNSLGVSDKPAAPIPSFVSFDVRWTAKPGAKLTPVTDTTNLNRFTGKYLDSTASIVWSARQPSTGYKFATNRGDTTLKTVSAVIGRERNGKFFSNSQED
jgi:hypothetical protein